MPVVLMLLMSTLVFASPPEDELSILLDVYAAEVGDLRSRNVSMEERQSFREDWLDRFLLGLAEHPESPSRRIAIAKAVGLANSTGNWEASKALTAELTQSSTTDDESVFWLFEQGEVSLSFYRTSGDSKQLDDAVSALRRGLALATDKSRSVPPDIRARAIEGGVALAMLLAETDRGSAEDVNSLLDVLTTLSGDLPPRVLARLESAGYGAERLAKTRLDAAIELVDQDLAIAAMEQLLHLAESNSLNSHFSSHLLRYADAAWPRKGGEYRNFLAKWESRAGMDSWRGHICFAIMSSAYADKSCEETVRYGEIILGESGNVLRDADAQKSDSNVSYMSETYGMLAECCKLMGLSSKANGYKESLAALSPGDRRLKSIGAVTESVVPRVQVQKRSVGRFVVFNLFVFAVAVLYFLIRYINRAQWLRRE